MTESEHTPSDDYYAREPHPERARRRGDSRGIGAWLQGAGTGGQQRIRLGALIAVLIAIGFIIWVAVGGSSSSSNNTPSAPAGANVVAGTPPVSLSFGGLKTLTAALHQTIYWIGTGPSSRYELRQLTNGYVYVRYLPPGVSAGDPRAFLTIGTYPMQNAYSITQGLQKSPDNVPLNPGHGGVAVYSRSNPTNAYVAFPGSNYQIEVYSPVHGRARHFVASGSVSSVPAGQVAKAGVTAVSPARLTSLSSSLGQPIYWAGAQPGTTYELTQTSNGRIFVRYLPKSVKPGATGTFLTVGTYPVANAYAITKALGSGKGNGSFTLTGGGIAAFGKAAATKNIYVAFRGQDYQIEVFDPTPGAARKLVQTGKIVAVS